MHFVRTLSSGNPELGLQRRLLDAVSDLMESTAGGLWVRSPEDASYVPGVSWNLGEGLPEPLGSPFDDWLGQHEEVIELAEATDAGRYPDLQVPDWLRTLPRAWLVVPLVHRDTLQGFMVLGGPRTDRQLDWEDYELLQAIGRQAASYIAEEQSANALSDARQLQLFSRRFAFVAHDLKNIVGQLSLLPRNAERFKANAQNSRYS
jgi:GAF domain-containing protein